MVYRNDRLGNLERLGKMTPQPPEWMVREAEERRKALAARELLTGRMSASGLSVREIGAILRTSKSAIQDVIAASTKKRRKFQPLTKEEVAVVRSARRPVSDSENELVALREQVRKNADRSRPLCAYDRT